MCSMLKPEGQYWQVAKIAYKALPGCRQSLHPHWQTQLPSAAQSAIQYFKGKLLFNPLCVLQLQYAPASHHNQLSMSRRSLLRLQVALSSCKHHKSQKRISSTGRVSHSLAITEPLSIDCPRLLRTAACLGLRYTALQEGYLLSNCQHLQQRRGFIGDGAPAKHHHERRLLG